MSPPETVTRLPAGREVAWGKVQILLASILWGTTGTAQALAPEGVQPLAVAAMRVALGGVALVLWAAFRMVLRPLRPLPVLIGALSLVLAQIAFFAALRRTGVAVGTVVAIGSSPIFAGALAWVVRREQPSRRWAIATALGIAGCVLLSTAGRSIEVDPVGILLALVVGAGYASYVMATKDLVAEHRPESVTAAVFGVASICMLPLLFFVDLSWTTRLDGTLVVSHLALITVAFAYTVFSRGLIVVPAATAVTLTLAEPLTAGVLGISVLGESLPAIAILGVVLVLIGLLLLTGVPSPSERTLTMGR